MPDVLSRRPRKARALTGRGALPKLGNLTSKTPEDLTRTLARFGIVPDLAAIDRAAHRAFDPIQRLIERGQIPDDNAWANVEDDLTRRVTNSLKDMVRGAIRLYRTERSRLEGGRMIWIATLKNSCDSCEQRHGEIKTFDEWEAEGLPGDPVLECCSFEPRCQCTLGPAGEDPEED